MHLKVAIVLLASLSAVSGCGGSKGSVAKVEGPVVPWVQAKPAQLAERSPAAAPCKAADLAMRGDVNFAANGRGGGIAVIALEHTGKQPCRLEGSPQIKLVKGEGPEQINTPLQRPPVIFPDTAYPLSTLSSLQPGEIAGLTLTWTNWCQKAVPGKPHLAPKALRITLPGQNGHLDANYNAVPPCLDPSKPSAIGVSPFETAKVKPTPPWTSASSQVTASVPGPPPHARRGALLHFVVVLRNGSQQTMRFDRCPSYVQQLVPAGEVEVHTLNCAAAKPIAPGASEAFAMQIRVPEKAPAGGNGLFWGLDPFGAKTPQLSSRAVVDK